MEEEERERRRGISFSPSPILLDELARYRVARRSNAAPSGRGDETTEEGKRERGGLGCLDRSPEMDTENRHYKLTSLIDGQRARDDAGGREGVGEEKDRPNGRKERTRKGESDVAEETHPGGGREARAKGMDVDQVRSSGYIPKLRILNWTPSLQGPFHFLSSHSRSDSILQRWYGGEGKGGRKGGAVINRDLSASA